MNTERRHFLDHAATSFPKPPVVWETFERIARLGAPAGRSAYRSATETDAAIELTRHRLARFVDAHPERVAFTLNATDAINTALKGVLRSGDHVVTTMIEHNSVVRPLAALESSAGISVTRVPVSSTGVVSPDDVRAAIRTETRLIAIVHASNVTGALQPTREIAHVAREHDLLFLLDAAQTAGLRQISMRNELIDLLALPGHKGLLGPPGTGALAFSERVDVRPLREGGTGFRSEETEQPEDYPQRLESGSPNAPGIAALGAALDWIESQGRETLESRVAGLSARLRAGLEAIEGLTLHGPPAGAPREAVYSVTLDGTSPGELAAILDSSFGVETRAGLHCAPGAHSELGTFPAGTCRLSLGATSRDEDVDAALSALGEIARGLAKL